jgi:glycosyltransferase involved in cell wall biosynthesis
VLVAVTMVRDEEDVIVPLVEHMLAEGVDRLIVADNLSSDGTREFLDGLARKYWPRVSVIDDPVPGYYQAQKMSALAEQARRLGARWVLPFDADEWFYASDGSLTIKQALDGCAADVVLAYGYDHIAAPADPQDEPNPFLRIQHRRSHHQKFPKVAFRASERAYLHMGNHGVERPGPRADGVLEYRHFQYRSLAHMTQKGRQGKAAFDAAPDIHDDHGTHWKRLGSMSDEELKAEWEALCASPDLVHDPAPLSRL